MTVWWITPALLIISAFVFRYCMKGYSYIAHLLSMAAAFTVIYTVCPSELCRIITFLIIGGTALFIGFEIPVILYAHTDNDCKRKYLIVLGAEVIGSKPSRSLQYRIDAAKHYLERFTESTAILSGGNGPNEDMSEASCMFEHLRDYGIAPNRMIKEEYSSSTRENLSLSFDIIRSLGDEPDGNVAILSSSYHLYRAKKTALSMNVRATGVAGYPGNPVLAANFFIREALGVARLLILGR
ncbi:MAG: YdcF family protein [Oscillospiraceae bacterium]|nr:YdcF family protein [Oscillospiraceae bacterium]